MSQPGPSFSSQPPQPPQRPQTPGPAHPPPAYPEQSIYGPLPGGGSPWPQLPGAVIMDGQPALPVEPTPFERVMFIMFWLGILALPAGFIALRAALDVFGWITMLIIIFGVIVMMGIQILLGAVAAANAGGFSRKAVGTRASIASLVYYGLWGLIGITFPDFDNRDFPSPVSRLVGSESAFFLGFALVAAAVVAVVVTLAMISADAGRVRERAKQNYYAAMSAASRPQPPCGGLPNSFMGGQQFGERHRRPPGQ